MQIRTWSLWVGLVLSGAAGLIYESSWTRMLHQVFGVSDLAVATVLASFFLGLGLGSAAAGRLAARTTRPARVYAAIEIAVACCAIASLWIVPGLRSAYESLGAGASFGTLTAMRWVFSSLVLLPPTVLMGATIPVLARIAARRSGWASNVTALYVANTTGAIAGAATAGFWSIPELGVRSSMWIAAGSSLAAAAVVLVAFRGGVEESASGSVAEPGSGVESGSVVPGRARLAVVLTSLSGATALAGEVLWTRVLRVVVHGTTSAFAAMLVNYLAGIALGAVLAPRIAKRFGALRAFGAIQMAAVLAFGVAMGIAPHLPRLVPLMRGEMGLVPHEPGVLLVVSGLLLFPLAILTGTGLPLTWAIAEEGASDASGASGRLLAANTLGGLVGSLAAGFLLVPVLGSEASLLAIAALVAVGSAVALRASAGDDLRGRVVAMASPFAALCLVFVIHPSIELPFLLAAGQDPLEAMVQGPAPVWRSDLVFLREGRNTTVTVRRRQGGLALYNDGRPESGFGQGEPGFGAELVALGALPGVFAEERRDALIVGLGAGHTTAVALASGFEHVTVVELEEAVVEASRLLYDARDRPFPLDDPRTTLRIDDARNQLALAPEGTLDAVISQPSHPWLAGSGALYTREFFLEVERGLRPGGVFALWVNLFRMDAASLASVLGTLTDVFPHVQAFVAESTSLVIAASETPFDWSRAEERLRTMPATAAFLAPKELDTVARWAAVLELETEAARSWGRDAPRILDDRPLLEFRLSRLPHARRLEMREIDRALEGTSWLEPDSTVRGLAGLEEIFEARIDRAGVRSRALGRLAETLDGTLELAPGARQRILGAIAEARGDITAALAAYDGSHDPRAAYEADRLRLAERDYEALLAVARSRDVLPSRSGPVLEAALALDRPGAISEALRIADAVRAAEDRDLETLTERYASGGCAALLGEERLETVTRRSAALAFVAQRCAVLAGDRPRASLFEEHAWRIRTVDANALTAAGESAMQEGNGGLAWVLLRRALATYPSSSRAAAALAQLHHRDHRVELARDVLIRAWAATEGLPEARARIAGTAQQLGLDLREAGIEVQAPDPSSASTDSSAGQRTSSD